MAGLNTETAVTEVPTTANKKYFGQTKAAWYIYWICAVASIANM